MLTFRSRSIGSVTIRRDRVDTPRENVLRGILDARRIRDLDRACGRDGGLSAVLAAGGCCAGREDRSSRDCGCGSLRSAPAKGHRHGRRRG
jgi:hypothetical protein